MLRAGTSSSSIQLGLHGELLQQMDLLSIQRERTEKRERIHLMMMLMKK
jgi:hypothetical protein